jgi:hemerythrin-like domain-containing protein
LSRRESELRASHVSAFFEYRLINHFKVEEELLFPAFREVLGLEASLIELLLSDHQELRAQAAAITSGAHDQVDSFCVLLERHIRTEERQLFVLPQDRMKPAKMAELGQQIKARLR